MPKTHYFFTVGKDKLVKYWDGPVLYNAALMLLIAVCCCLFLFACMFGARLICLHTHTLTLTLTLALTLTLTLTHTHRGQI